MVRVTFSLDEATVATLKRTAARLRRPQSQIVREAVAEFAARSDRLSESERIRLLDVLDRLKKHPASRSTREVGSELAAIRRARRDGGRRRNDG